MDCNIPETVVNDIVEFARENNIQKVILFGSRAKGTHTERSDIDIAVSGGNFDGFYWSIKEKVRSLLSFDIVDLDTKISEELQGEIERNGIVIYEKYEKVR